MQAAVAKLYARYRTAIARYKFLYADWGCSRTPTRQGMSRLETLAPRLRNLCVKELHTCFAEVSQAADE